MEFKDYYALLGVTPETPLDEIKRAYRKMARQYHPDVSKLPEAEKKFKEINEAWEVLKDPQKRAQYDQVRAGGWPRGGGGAHGQAQHAASGFQDASPEEFSEFFQSIFGGMQGGFHEGRHPFRGSQRGRRARGHDLRAKVQVPLSVAFEGGMQTLTIPSTLSSPEKANAQTKSLNVKIPAGVTEGSQIRLKAQGGAGIGGGVNGDLYLEIEIAPHPFFSVHNKDIHLTLGLAPWEAALGTSIEVPTLGGSVTVKIQPDAKSGQKLRLKGRGLPGDPPGDQYVILQIQVPKPQTQDQKQLYEEMAKAMPFNPRAALGV